MESAKQLQVHIVLIHGACHGAWSWYKLKPLLEAADHRVTALDLSASGIDSRSLYELRTFADYTQPLIELMAAFRRRKRLGPAMDDGFCGERLVAEIKGCLYWERTPAEEWLDTEFLTYGTPEQPLTSMFFGPNFVASKLYQLYLFEDVALAKMLLRPSSLFREDLSRKSAFSKERFGSVKRVYIVCTEDRAIPVNFQRWQIETIGVAEVKELRMLIIWLCSQSPYKFFNVYSR
ncbi:hypothetical protein BUALT_Bualt04G0122100 [Buddleja alternifolia]|uniref:AB hydrolase-1 domain-containing protein n=1 Tax=Buddleja alternifolia TaxID=168488 RepID=A0AAV6XZK3_9LAMI|nr:hypothetical protein BUALT_Bualt04G0122100 [Buddleja alternifolia]